MMAPLLAPSSPAPRISQVLPTVKCSNCSFPVPLAELGDHVCQTPPPLPKQPALLPARLQNLVTSPPRSVLRTPSNASSTRARTPSNNAPRPSLDVRSPSRAATPSNNPPPRARTPSSRPSLDIRAPAPSRPSLDTRARTPSNSTSPRRAAPPTSDFVSPPPRQGSYAPRSPAPPADAYPSPITPRRAPFRDEIDTKTGGEAGMAGVGRRAFAAAARAAMVSVRPPYPAEPLRANAPRYLDINNTGYAHPHGSPPDRSSTPRQPHSPHSRTPSPRTSSNLPPQPPPPKTPIPSIPSPTNQIPTPITPTATSARLPFFEKFKKGLPPTNTLPDHNNNTVNANNTISGNSNHPITKSNLNSNADANYPATQGRMRSASTASKSTATSGSLSYSSPSKSPTGRQRSHTQSSVATSMSPSSGEELGLAYADSTADEDEVFEMGKKFPGKEDTNKQERPPVTHSILRNGNSRQDTSVNHIRFPSSSSVSPSIKKNKNSIYGKRTTMNSNSVYSVSDEEENDWRGEYRSVVRSVSTVSSSSGKGSHHGSPKRRQGNTADVDADPDQTIGALDRVVALVTDGRGDEIDWAEIREGRKSTLPSSPAPHRSNTVPAGVLHSPDSAGKRLPSVARSNTTPASGVGAHAGREREGEGDVRESARDGGVGGQSQRTRKRNVRVCVRCERRIEDGRWVALDEGAGVLCERCWKNMYLPKCRRCNLPIEKQAVSSSDGQLKGKYHKECFNCHTCHKPFPSKTFYVHDGKPYCAYHYHEANQSLCALATCGQPIEGPCAVSHAGDRYHPEHLLCEWTMCKERLASEYWEVDGRMLCERHAQRAMREAADSESEYDDDEGEVQTRQGGRAMKRMTRFIDLGAGLR